MNDKGESMKQPSDYPPENNSGIIVYQEDVSLFVKVKEIAA